MSLHEKELSDISLKGIDVESLYKIRLVNNMLLNKIDSSKWENYYNLFAKQQILSYEDIGHCEGFSRRNSGTLVVPKDREESDAVLKKVYENYIRENACRDSNWWYSTHSLSVKNDKFYIGEECIKSIRFLFDNTTVGSATVRTLAACLGKKTEWLSFEMNRMNKDEQELVALFEKQIGRCQQYKCEGRVVGISDIMKANHPNIEVYSYYGTDEGKKCIDDFLKLCNIMGNIKVEYIKKLTRNSEDVKFECTQLGIPYLKTYIIIREFNMPKRYLLPRGAVGKANSVVTLLVRKEEL